MAERQIRSAGLSRKGYLLAQKRKAMSHMRRGVKPYGFIGNCWPARFSKMGRLFYISLPSSNHCISTMLPSFLTRLKPKLKLFCSRSKSPNQDRAVMSGRARHGVALPLIRK